MRSSRHTPLFPELGLPTAEQPRHYTVRAHTYAWMGTFDGGIVPCISAHGSWLYNAGFKPGARVTVNATKGRLIFDVMDPPKEPRIRKCNAFEKYIADRYEPKPGYVIPYEHPGLLVREHILGPMGASTLDFAHAIGVSQDLAECFLAGDHDVDMDLAERLAPFASTSQWFWWELQQKHLSTR
ncbi:MULTISPECIES: hypothetical protein [Stenotrophomonas]|jgi:plasmid maintenance system antidote protein VapI|uniref:Uncharacterized protein n=1 Tax=Stenotrophomonas aracearum TaxID=3003272 RepID=A0ABY9Y8T9_9GAMM|nr:MULTISPECIES: hypothetical protein [unclassified Stenotrophomonas]WNH47284.1 hypothetical protein PDM28_11285 [Stenotrophomonas sp. A5588]